LDAPLDDGEIDNYCRKFADFMQAQLHSKYDLRSSRKRPRMQDQNEELPHTNPSKLTEKGKKPLDQVPLNKKESLDHIPHKPEVSKTEPFPPHVKPIYDQNKEPVDVAKNDRKLLYFSLQKELEKVKIFVPLT